jgi:hypothetical protein
MSKKILILVRKFGHLKVYEDDGGRLRNPILFDKVTGVKRDSMGWYDVMGKNGSLGYVSNVKEVREEW